MPTDPVELTEGPCAVQEIIGTCRRFTSRELRRSPVVSDSTKTGGSSIHTGDRTQIVACILSLDGTRLPCHSQ
eukprot:15452534-Alexandrium_andersonii.AAC.1